MAIKPSHTVVVGGGSFFPALYTLTVLGDTLGSPAYRKAQQKETALRQRLNITALAKTPGWLLGKEFLQRIQYLQSLIEMRFAIRDQTF